MMTKEGSTKIINFMTPGAGVLVQGRGHIGHLLKMHYFFKNLLHYSLGSHEIYKYGKPLLEHHFIYLVCLIYTCEKRRF